MAQFHAYQNSNPASRHRFPYLLDIQSDLFDELRTTVVVPLSPAQEVARFTISKLNPALEIEGDTYTAMIQDMAGIDRNQLGPEVYDLRRYSSEIIAAFDFLFSGI